jgi:hypothetical protein
VDFFWDRRGGGISRKTVIALISVADGGGVGNQISLRSSEMSTNQSESRLVCRGWVPASINFRNQFGPDRSNFLPGCLSNIAAASTAITSGAAIFRLPPRIHVINFGAEVVESQPPNLVTSKLRCLA